MTDSHYDADYFAWHRSIGAFGGRANLIKFADYVTATDHVVDFGCGGGYLLANLPGAVKIGIEINDVARAAASEHGVTTVASADEIADGWADVVVSNHALEHCRNPFGELEAVMRILRPGGRAVFVVPCESIIERYNPADPSHHLYTWNPMTLGNLFAEVGFAVQECVPFIHRWPPHYHRWARLGWGLFHAYARLYGHLHRDISQVRIVATRPQTSGTQHA